jgi:replicative DNA helicase
MTKGEDEYTRMTHVSLALQQLAKAQNCTILTLSQVSNTVARENTSKVIEYKGSGAIAMVCDLGFTIQREDYVEGTTHQGLILTLRKNRRGISGYTFPLGTNIPGGAIYEA